MPAPVDWSSLSPDLVSCIGDIFLGGGDIDYYMSLRVVCRIWRAATDDPRGVDSRFRPKQWVMLDVLSYRTESRLFLKIDTGRFLWMDMPPLDRRFRYIGADNGLLILEVRHKHGYGTCILNPFTGFMVRFPSNRPRRMCRRVAMGADMASPLLFSLLLGDGVCHDLSDSSPLCLMDSSNIASSLCTAVSFQGRIYGANMDGSVMAVDRSDGHRNIEITTIIHNNGEIGESFLVDNAGELLLVHVPFRFRPRRTHVFRVNLTAKALEPTTKNIRTHAIFLGRRCCLSVNADYFPAIKGNCIYRFENIPHGVHLYECHLSDDSRDALAIRPVQRPLSLVEVFMQHCGSNWWK